MAEKLLQPSARIPFSLLRMLHAPAADGEGASERSAPPVALFWCSCVALTLTLAASSVVGTAAFVRVTGLADIMAAGPVGVSDVAMLAGSFVLLTMGAVSSFRPAFFNARATFAVAASTLVAGALLFVGGIASASWALLCIGACVVSAGRAVSIVVVGMALSRLTLDQAGLCIAFAFLAEYAIGLVAWLMPVHLELFCFLAFPFIATLIAWRWAEPLVRLAAAGAPPADYAVTQPHTTLPLSSRLFMCLFLFRLAWGFSLGIGNEETVTLVDFAGLVPVVGVALYVLILQRRFSSDRVTLLATLFIVAGFIVAPADAPFALTGGTVLLSMGGTAFNMVTWLVLVALVVRNQSGAVAMFSWGFGIASLGTATGKLLGEFGRSLAASDAAGFSLLAGALAVAIVAFALFGLRSFSFAETINGVVAPVPTPDAAEAAEAGEPAPVGAAEGAAEAGGMAETGSAAEAVKGVEQLIADRCERLGERFGLSPREREVFAMLARGRDRAYIEKRLMVSRNTVKTHVKHIYAKVGIHSHQDLIDLVACEFEEE